MIGILIFFVILALVLLALRIIGDKSYDKFYPSTKKTEHKELIGQDEIISSNINQNDLIAIISAAAFEVVGGPITIKKINFIEDDSNAAWKNIGRLTNLSSHTIQEKK
jgi:hypothetical protein